MTKLTDIGERMLRELDELVDDAEREFMLEVAPHLPGMPMPPALEAYLLLESRGRLEFYAPPKRKRGERRRPAVNMLDEIIKDARRLRASSIFGTDFKLEVAAEWHLRVARGYCTIDDLGKIELDDLVERLIRRHRGSGTTGAERARRAKR